MESVTWQLFVDGASRSNPGQAGAGIVIKKNGQLFYEDGFYLGIKTNNQAEYLGLLIGLYFLQQHCLWNDFIQIFSDSELLVKQIKKIYRVRNPALIPLYDVACRFMNQYPSSINHVRREQNSAADKMANQGVDRKNPLPDPFIAQLMRQGIRLD